MYLCISIGSVTPTGDRNKYKLEISISTCISSVPFIRNLNKYKYGSFGRHKHSVKSHKVQVDRIILMTRIGTRPEIPRKSRVM